MECMNAAEGLCWKKSMLVNGSVLGLELNSFLAGRCDSWLLFYSREALFQNLTTDFCPFQVSVADCTYVGLTFVHHVNNVVPNAASCPSLSQCISVSVADVQMLSVSYTKYMTMYWC